MTTNRPTIMLWVMAVPARAKADEGVCSIQMTTSSSRSRCHVKQDHHERFPKDQITEDRRMEFVEAKPVESPAWNGRIRQEMTDIPQRQTY